MPTRTISNAGGNSNTVGAWTEGAVPTSADEIVATGTSGNLTVNAALACRSIDLTGYTGTLTHNSGVTISVGDGTAPTGNVALKFPSSGWTYTPASSTSIVSFVSTSATQLSIDFGGKYPGQVVFNGAGGSWALASALGLSGTSVGFRLTFTAGAFDANGFTVRVGSLLTSGTAVRSVVMGAGDWTVTGDSSSIVSITGSNFTLTRGGPLICTLEAGSGSPGISQSVAEASTFGIRVTGGSSTVTISNCYDLILDGFSGTLANTARSVYGNFTITSNSSGVTLGAGGNATTFAATSGTKTITTAGKTLDFPVIINGVGGTVQFGENITLGSSRDLTLTAGTLDANDFNVDCRAFLSSGTGVRSLLMGSGTWTLRHITTAWNTGTTTNLTFNAETSSILLDGNGATFSGGGLTFYAVDLGTSGTKTIQGSNTFHTLTRIISAAATITFTDGTTTTVTNSLTLKGASGQPLTLKGSSTIGWTLAVPATQDLDYLSVSRSTATGNAAIVSHGTDGGNNVNWVFPPAFSVNPSCDPTTGTTATTFTFSPGTITGGGTLAYSWEYRADGSADPWVEFSTDESPEVLGSVFGSGAWATRLTATNVAGSATATGDTITVESSGGVQQTRRLRLGLGMGL